MHFIDTLVWILERPKIRPNHRLSAERIVGTKHPNFVAVPNHRRADVRHLNKHRQLRAAICLGRRPRADVPRTRPLAIRLVVAATRVRDHRNETIGVVPREQILQDCARLLGIGKSQRGEARVEFARLEIARNPRDDGLCKRIVHHRVKGLAIEPCIGALPNLADDVGIGVRRLHHIAPRAPEAHRYFIRHIEPPTVDTVGRITIAVWIHPTPRHIHDVLRQRCAREPIIRLSKRWQLPKSCPTAIDKRLETLDFEPVCVRRLTADRAAPAYIAECDMRLADVIENAVDNHAESRRFQLAQHLEEKSIALVETPRRRVEKILVRRRHLCIAL